MAEKRPHRDGPMAWLGVKPERIKPYPNLTPRQVWIMGGFAKWLAMGFVQGIRQQQEQLCKIREGGRFGIAVHDDPIALWYQVLEYRVARVEWGVGLYGMLGKQVWGENGFEHVDVMPENRARMTKLRERAHHAKKILEPLGKWGNPLRQPQDDEWDTNQP